MFSVFCVDSLLLFSRYYYFSFFEFFFPNILSFLISYIGYSTQQNRIAYFIYELIFIRTCKFAICILKLRQLWTTSWKTCRSRNEIGLIFELFLPQIQSSILKHILCLIFDYNGPTDLLPQRTRWKTVEKLFNELIQLFNELIHKLSLKMLT